MSSTKCRIQLAFSLAAASIIAAQPASADVVHNDDVIITGNVCEGSAACVSGRAFTADVEVVGTPPDIILFDDTAGADDWEFEASADDLTFKNHVDGGGIFTVVWLNGGAPANSLVVTSNGSIGLGTSTPGQELQLAFPAPSIRFEDTDEDQTWDINGDASGFRINDVSLGVNRFLVSPGSGNIGIGTDAPTEELHIRRASGARSVRILTESSDNGAVQWLMKTNSTNRRFVAQDAAGNNQSQILFENGGTIKFLGATAAVPLMTVSPSGLSLPAAAYCGSNGGVPGPGGCDAVFTPGYQIESIEEHAASMWGDSHLPAVGPTPDGKTIEFNVHQRYFSMLNELEKAHIYIERLNEENKRQKTALAELESRVAGMAAMEKRLARMEGLLAMRSGKDD